jgi:hypothetical protein
VFEDAIEEKAFDETVGGFGGVDAGDSCHWWDSIDYFHEWGLMVYLLFFYICIYYYVGWILLRFD